MNVFKKALILATAAAASAVLFSSQNPAFASSTPGTPGTGLIEGLSQVALRCAFQPYKIQKGGRLAVGPIQSFCPELKISADRAEFHLAGGLYTIVASESENSDGGDLNDLYLEFASREDQSVLIASHIPAFGDPIAALLLAAGHSPDQLPDVAVNAFSTYDAIAVAHE